MPCIENIDHRVRRGLTRRLTRRLRRTLLLACATALAGCANKPAPAPTPAPPAAVRPKPAPAPPAEVVLPPANPTSTLPTKPGVRYVQLGPPAALRNTNELQQQFARRLIAAHPDTSYMTASPPRLWAIPVIEVELYADGSVRHINVLRQPSTGTEATQLAIDAIRRAAPFGDVSRLPKPWRVVETFLFDDDLRFKPRTLDAK